MQNEMKEFSQIFMIKLLLTTMRCELSIQPYHPLSVRPLPGAAVLPSHLWLQPGPGMYWVAGDTLVRWSVSRSTVSHSRS